MLCAQSQLPDYHMTAGETQTITVNLYTETKKKIDAKGMTARLAITSHLNQCGEPFVVKDCRIATLPDENSAVLQAALEPADTVDLFGKYVYQITAKDWEGNIGVLKGVMYIDNNIDRAAITI